MKHELRDVLHIEFFVYSVKIEIKTKKFVGDLRQSKKNLKKYSTSVCGNKKNQYRNKLWSKRVVKRTIEKKKTNSRTYIFSVRKKEGHRDKNKKNYFLIVVAYTIVVLSVVVYNSNCHIVATTV